MKILWWIIQGVIMMGSLTLTYLPLIEAVINKEAAKYLGLDWKIWLLIGLSIFVLSIAGVIIRLILQLRYYYSKDYKRKTEKEDLEIEELRKRMSPLI